MIIIEEGVRQSPSIPPWVEEHYATREAGPAVAVTVADRPGIAAITTGEDEQ